MNKEELLFKALSYCTDRNVGNLDLENEAEEFGALLAFGYVFKKILQMLREESKNG